MPVQDTEKKTETSAPVQDEAEKLRQQKQAERPKKLLPFLNAKAQHHQSRIDSLDGKIAAETDKVDRLMEKIGGLKAQAQELSDRNRFLKETFGEFPLVQSMIEKNEKRIQKILDVKIPKCSQKIDMSIDKINAFSAKSQVIQHKLDRVVALSDTVKSFRIRMNTERRAVFSDAMDRLSQASVDCLSDKKAELTKQRQELFTKYDAPETSMSDKLEIQKRIDYLSEQISNIDEKIAKYNLPDNHFKDKSEEVVDAAIVLTSEKLNDMASRGQFTVTGMTEQSLDAAQSTMTMEPEILAETAKRAIAGVEEMTEDNANNIDGILNNKTQVELEEDKNSLTAAIENMQSLIDNPYTNPEMKAIASQDIERLQNELAVVESVLAQMHEEPIQTAESLSDYLINLAADGKAEISDNNAFKINAEYYFSLESNDRHFESITSEQAFDVMQKLDSSGIAFSAVSRSDDKVSFTVAKKDEAALKTAIGKSVDKYAQKRESAQQEQTVYQTVNPSYYASLSDDNRVTTVEASQIGIAIMKKMEDAKLPFSAVFRQNDNVAITVSKDNAQAYAKIAQSVKNVRADKYINPEFYKALPKALRVTQQMPEQDARKLTATLEQKGIPHSAIMDGKNSAVTVSKKDEKRAFFTRDSLKRSAQRIGQKGKNEQQKKKQQGLE